MKNNQLALQAIKAQISKTTQQHYITQEAMLLLIKDEMLLLAKPDGHVFSTEDISLFSQAQRNVTARQLKNGDDALIPGIMRIQPGSGGLTKRPIKIKSISRYLLERL